MSKLWIDALEFENYGGFYPETQFIQEMGQGYLFASDIPGIPVKSASTHFNISSSAKYRIWVRTKNWYKSASPGKLKFLVDDKYLPREAGALPTEQWSWEALGDLDLDTGTHELIAEDTTGYFGRFAAILVTDDMDFTPEHKMERLWKERAIIRGTSLTPIDKGSYDIIVAGGGPAGVPAAIAAARKGMKVALIHSRPGLGGNASDEGTVGFDGAYSEHPNMRESGIAEELRRIHDHDKLSWEWALRKLADAESNLTIFYNQFLIDSKTANGFIEEIKTIDCQTGGFYRFSGSIFIDCTGDGWLGYYSGASYRIGREAKWQYNEEFAPENPDNLTMSGCIMGTCKGQQVLCYYAEDAGEPVPFTAPAWAVQLPEGDNLHRSPGRLKSGEWWVENPTDMDDLWEQEAIRDELLRLSLGYFHWIKNSYSRRDVARNLKIVGFGRYNAKRETRRIIGDYVLTQNDCHGARFKDAISYCGWPLDVHHPKGIYSGAEGPYFSNSRVPITEIPFRCLYSKNISNLLMAGRCMSVSHLALGSVRVENTLATLGQAAGTAAAYCIKYKITPREIYQDRMSEFQQILIRDDLHIPSVPNKNKSDLALSANLSASSISETEHFNLKKGVEGEYIPLNHTWAATQKNCPKAEFVQVFIKNEKSCDTPLQTEFLAMENSRDVENAVVIDTAKVLIPAHFEGWFSLPLKTQTDKQHIAVVLKATNGILWKSMNCTSFQKMRGYQLNQYRWEMDHSNSFMTKFFNEPFVKADCSPENVINGWGRVIDKDIYEWVSDPNQALPQFITLSWDAPQLISNVDIIFDTDLINPAMSYISLPNVVKCVSDYDVEILADGVWIKVAEVKDNYMRRAVHNFEETAVKKLCINVKKTCGDKSARIFKISTYSR